jgi:hypothetical protein
MDATAISHYDYSHNIIDFLLSINDLSVRLMEASKITLKYLNERDFKLTQIDSAIVLNSLTAIDNTLLKASKNVENCRFNLHCLMRSLKENGQKD